MATATYYFNGNGGITDPGGLWTNDSNAFDGNTYSVSSASQSSGTSSKTSNYLQGIGTNSPASGGTVTQVRVRVNGSSGFGTSAAYATVYSNANEELGTAVGLGGSSSGFGSYVTLSEPAAGWSFTEVQALYTRCHSNNVSVDGVLGIVIGKVEIEVTYTPTTGTSNFLSIL